MDSYEKYCIGTYCAKNLITTKLTRIYKSIERSLNTKAKGDRLAKELLSRAKSQADDLVKYIPQFMDDLRDTSDFPQPAAHQVVGRCMRSLFTDLYNTRSQLLNIGTFETLEAKAEFAWTMIETTLRMEDVIDKHFRGHQIISNELQLFMLESRVDRSRLERVEQAGIDAKEASEEAVSKISKVEAAVEKVRQDLGNLRTAVNKVKK